MNARKRKKWLKKHGKYVSNHELWNLDVTICEWILPRLRKFKEINIAYPGTEECPTSEKWDEILDKMILSFEMAKLDPIDEKAGLDLYDENCKIKVPREVFIQRIDEWNNQKQEGLDLFAKYFNYLWI